MRWLVPAMILIPAAELGILLWAGDVLGLLPTLALIVATGVSGAYLAKRQGLKVIRDIQNQMASFMPPGDALIRGAFVLAGGIMLLTPGFLTDFFGLTLLFGPTQNIYKPFIAKMIHKRMKNGRIIVM